ncbi:MAG: hypothetical protein K2X01_02995 [Cyanobacteria bacterium]|nr:hypothetical protein [Cyanobacteriota bacterium]
MLSQLRRENPRVEDLECPSCHRPIWDLKRTCRFCGFKASVKKQTLQNSSKETIDSRLYTALFNPSLRWGVGLFVLLAGSIGLFWMHQWIYASVFSFLSMVFISLMPSYPIRLKRRPLASKVSSKTVSNSAVSPVIQNAWAHSLHTTHTPISPATTKENDHWETNNWMDPADFLTVSQAIPTPRQRARNRLFE